MRNLSYTKKGPGRRHRGPGHAKRKAEWLKKNAIKADKYSSPLATVQGGIYKGLKLYVIEATENYKLRMRGAAAYFKRKGEDALVKLRGK